jgi:hypothetical protein
MSFVGNQPESTPSQQRTAAARRAFAEQFTSAEEKSEHYRRMAQKANAGRLVLRPDDVSALVTAYQALRSVAERAGAVRPDATAADQGPSNCPGNERPGSEARDAAVA